MNCVESRKLDCVAQGSTSSLFNSSASDIFGMILKTEIRPKTEIRVAFMDCSNKAIYPSTKSGLVDVPPASPVLVL